MSVVHIIPTLKQGGAEAILSNLVARSPPIVKHHIVLMQDARFFATGDATVETLGVDLKNKGQVARAIPSAIAKLRRSVIERKADVLVGWIYYGAFLSMALKATGVPIVWAIHNSTLPGFMAKPVLASIDRILAAASWRVPERIIYCGVTVRRMHERSGYKRSIGEVIFNGVSTDLFRPDAAVRRRQRRELGLVDDVLAVGLFARHDAQKDIEGSLAAFADFAGRFGRPAQLVLVGSGMTPSNPSLAAGIARYGLSRQVLALGPRHDMGEMHAAMDVVMLGSRYGEALPLVLIEALASGIRVVTTDLGDIRALPLPDYAIVSPGQPDALAQALCRVASDGADADVWQRASAATRAQFSIETCVAHHIGVFENVAEKRRLRSAAARVQGGA